MVAEVPKIFEAVFQVTLQMITKNFEVNMASTRLQPNNRVLLFDNRILFSQYLVAVWPTTCTFLTQAQTYIYITFTYIYTYIYMTIYIYIYIYIYTYFALASLPDRL